MPSGVAKQSPLTLSLRSLHDSKISPMTSQENSEAPPATADVTTNPFSATDAAEILRDRRWLDGELSPAQAAWCERAAAMLGPQVEDRSGLVDLLSLVFHYDAAKLMEASDTHVTMSRYGARGVLRRLARLILESSAAFDSERFKEVVTTLKATSDIRSRELFQPLRLALAGRAGEGDLDRVILLVDEAAAASFAAKVKTVRERALEFCAALD
jgi:Anticodon binding domain